MNLVMVVFLEKLDVIRNTFFPQVHNWVVEIPTRHILIMNGNVLRQPDKLRHNMRQFFPPDRASSVLYSAQMKTKLKAVKAPKVLREPVDFETWKGNLVPLLKRRSPELDAFEKWIQNHSAYFAQIGRSELTDTNTLLEVAFQCTQPEVSSNEEIRKYEVAVNKIRELLPEIDAAIGALKSAGSCIVPRDGMPGQRFNKLQRSMEEAANQIRWALILIHKPNAHSADLVSYCITFLASIFACDIDESAALALTCVLMKAHGFSDDELIVFGSGAVESGRFRKRVKAYIKANSDIKKAQEAFLEQQRSRKTGDVKVLSHKLAELIKEYSPKSI
jgi:hypothetical protein